MTSAQLDTLLNLFDQGLITREYVIKALRFKKRPYNYPVKEAK